MAVLKRYGKWYDRFEFRGQEVYMPTEAKNKSEAETIEVTMKKALRTNDFEGLDQHSKTLLIRHFENKELEVPEALREKVSSAPPVQSDELTLRDAARIACTYSETQRDDTDRKERSGLLFIGSASCLIPFENIAILLQFAYALCDESRGGGTSKSVRLHDLWVNAYLGLVDFWLSFLELDDEVLDSLADFGILVLGTGR